MNRIWCAVAGTVCVLVGLPCDAGAQAPRAGETLVRLDDGVVLAFSMEGAKHEGTMYLLEDRAAVHHGEIHRLVVDEQNVARFAYALTAQTTLEHGAVLKLRPIRRSEAFEAFAPRRPAGETGPFTFQQRIRFDERLSTPVDEQVASNLQPGDVVRLDLFEHARTGQRVTDVIRVVALSPTGVRRVEAVKTASAEAARARPTLRFDGLTILRNGTLVAEQSIGNSAAGHVLMLGLRGRGTLVFSAEADADEPPLGMAAVDGDVLRFWLDHEEFEVKSSEPIAPDGLVALWMYFEPGDPTWIRTPPADGVRPGTHRIWLGAGNDVQTSLRNLRHGRAQR